MIPLHKSLSFLTRRKLIVVYCALATFLLAILLHFDNLPLASAGGGKAQLTAFPETKMPARRVGCCTSEEANQKPHLLAGSYYSLKNKFSAKLLLNNKGPNPIEVQPTLFSMDGERFDAPPITVDANSHRFEDFAAWAAIAGEQFREGSIQVFHRGKDLVLGVQIYLTDETRSLSFEEKLTELGKPASSQLEGVWWLPSPKGAIKLVLSNTSDTPLSVSTAIRGEVPRRESSKNNSSDIVYLAPHETKVLDVEQDLLEKEQGAMSAFGAISVKHNGGPRALLARGLALDTSRGYSLPIQFVDPGSGKSTNLQGAGLRIGKAGKESLSPIVVAHNAGETEMTVNGRVPYTDANGTSGEVILPQFRLLPGETQLVDLVQYAKAHNVTDSVATAGLEFQYTGDMGSLITSAFSVSKSGNQVFRVPLWDIAAQRSATGGYPWYIDGSSSTVVYIKNVTDEPRQFRMYLTFNGGEYARPLATVAPGQTALVDIRELRDAQIPDANGQTIPQGVTRGQVQWSMTGGVDKVLIGRSEQVDIVRGISSNYACQNCCGNSFYDGWVTPGQSTGFEDDQMQFIAMQRDQNCYGQIYLPYTASIPSYSSADTSICNPGWNTGMTTGVGPGETTISAGWTADAWFMNLNEVCDYTPVEAVREAVCQTLQNPSSLSVISVALLPDGTTQSTDGCPDSQATGIKVGVTLQVLDRTNNAIARSDMRPQEKVTDTSFNGTSQGDPVPDWSDIGPSRITGTSQFTNEDGRFLDAAYGFCWPSTFSTYKFKQQISILIGSRRFNVRTNNVTVTGTTLGHGTITNGSDIQKNRP